jgi:hypothetical protein
VTQTAPASQAMRECRLYRFYVSHPVTGERVLGYIGETWQMPFDRLMQHVRDQPWADTMLGWELDPVVYWGKAAVQEAERLATLRECPLYPYENNLSNPNRIEIWRAKEQRWARDDAAGKRRWVPPTKEPRRAPTQQPAPIRSKSITVWWTPNRIKEGLWSASWIGTGAIAWVNLDDVTLWQPRLGVSAAAGLLLVGWVRAGMPVTKAQRRRVRGRIRRGGLRKWRRW